MERFISAVKLANGNCRNAARHGDGVLSAASERAIGCGSTVRQDSVTTGQRQSGSATNAIKNMIYSQDGHEHGTIKSARPRDRREGGGGMTRYWVEDKDLQRMPVTREGLVMDATACCEVIKATDLPAHDAQLRAQVWEEAAKEAQGTMLPESFLPTLGIEEDTAADVMRNTIATALRQRGGEGK